MQPVQTAPFLLQRFRRAPEGALWPCGHLDNRTGLFLEQLRQRSRGGQDGRTDDSRCSRGTREFAEAVSNDVDVRGNPPAGLIAHVLIDVPGGVRAVDIWESGAELQTFANERQMPSVQKVSEERGLSPDEFPDPTVVEAYDFFVRGS